MRYKKYAEEINLYDITSEPTEYTYFSFSPTIHPIEQNNTNYILIIFFSCFSGMLLFVCLIKVYQLKYKRKVLIKPNYDDNFGTDYTLDDV